MQTKGAEILIKLLIKYGVNTVFGYPGGTVIPLYDALYDFRDQINHILVRHEQGAAHAAEGYARVSGKAGVCIATSGPGATNLVTGIANAMMDSTPLVCITGQVSANLVGSDAFQETDVMAITAPITKWNYQISSSSQIPFAVTKAFEIATSGRPGPVLLEITRNAQTELFEFQIQSNAIATKPSPQPKLSLIRQAADLLNCAHKPYILAGHGVLLAQATTQLRELAEKCQIPVAVTLHGLSSIPKSHPLYAGLLGMHGNYSTNLLTNQADVILAVGMRFDDRVTGKLSAYAKQAKIIHIDIDQAELHKNVPVNIAINADAKTALISLLKITKKAQHQDWIGQFKKLDQVERNRVILPLLDKKEGILNMAEVIDLLSKKTSGKATIVTDVGQHQMVTARYYGFEKTNSFITSGGLGTMGFGLPAAIGAQIANPAETVITVVGDGSFQMTLQELATVTQEKLPIKIILLNNGFLGMVRQWQNLFFDQKYSFVNLQNPDFVKLAESFSIKAEKVKSREELEKAMSRMLNSKEAYLLDIDVEKELNIFPMVAPGSSVEEVRLS
ncbi:MAG: biosynthetic-type acetolactate synthase large subunit [Armatimonadetes bacterium]|nr:MAG: biosynthetic-type acetolactate synthase large subunit [Armatimonadota bacterium]